MKSIATHEKLRRVSAENKAARSGMVGMPIKNQGKTLKDEKEIFSLTGLRFVAAFYVFLFHIHIRWPISDHPFTKKVLDQGAIGMSLFFLLSGFVLAYRYADGQSTLKDYLVNRFARIYPIYSIAALVTLPWIGISLVSSSLADTLRWIGQIVLLVLSNIFLIQAWFIQYFSYWNDGGSWSISVEVFCYILLPFLLPSLLQASMKRLFVIAAACWLLAVLPGLSAALFSSPSNGVFYSMPIFRLPEFLIGACTYLAIRLGFKYQWGAALQVAVLVIFLLYLGFAGSEMPLYVGHNWIALPVIAFMIFSLSNEKGLVASILASRIFVWLGKISYCFYSFQALIILLLISHHDKLIQVAPALSNNKLLAIVSLAVLVALSASGYYLIEEPARRWIRRYHKRGTILRVESASQVSI
jgi:peptidoglycan/LPS O-acetylase OafA/YrhL